MKQFSCKIAITVGKHVSNLTLRNVLNKIVKVHKLYRFRRNSYRCTLKSLSDVEKLLSQSGRIYLSGKSITFTVVKMYHPTCNNPAPSLTKTESCDLLYENQDDLKRGNDDKVNILPAIKSDCNINFDSSEIVTDTEEQSLKQLWMEENGAYLECFRRYGGNHEEIKAILNSNANFLNSDAFFYYAEEICEFAKENSHTTSLVLDHTDDILKKVFKAVNSSKRGVSVFRL
ncbi:uncharacterized protein LOC111705882 [Eurytemora carolleeae]|uniref:uncharacterized protein LOC111705882 n=1 Tax=Eurytemora carolleeae TaxID=1294199 RepID=UPI000C77B28B|nr:uncharacterized protein LOC111705882 [Eurytemora carolleeae]|eukprot:XP_023334349.1 uncharacterized protein LOC111705882 [Eurytemora affinis]